MAPSDWDPFSAAVKLGLGWADAWASMAGVLVSPVQRDLPWITPHRVVLDTSTFRLLEFPGGSSPAAPVLIVTPYALHGATLADLAPGHSLVERLLLEGIAGLHLIEWKSATERDGARGIDGLLADLTLAIDDLGGRADLVGLCQGGWLSLMAAARHPGKVSRLVLAGAPVDLDASPSLLADRARASGAPLIETWRRWGDGIVSGSLLRAAWLSAAGAADPSLVLEVDRCEGPLLERYQAWDQWAFDLPSSYLREVAVGLFIENRLARGEFICRGRKIDLRTIRGPIYVLAGLDDRTTPPGQAIAAVRLTGSSSTQAVVAPCGHLSLFMGARTLAVYWPAIATWLLSDATEQH